ncbi:transcription antitermination factor NusB [Aerococcus sanguinicola]|uniref:Transcription antitermination protein NusB n=2 Tax=Aerococcus sanguinicola TaxID=119206 RepID=A0A2I1MT58_9LACT|nr:transcription antitermination factor NusB [Aerococcus sanguinicola]PKZ23310.1 transcription antitermination factor NusB [Aerococcus sanguinicola]
MNKGMKLGTSQIREIALLVLYQQALNPELAPEACMTYVLENLDQLKQVVKYEEVDEEGLEALKDKEQFFEKQQQSPSKGNDFTAIDFEEGEELPPYLLQLVSGVLANQEAIDARLDQSISGKWSVKRLEKINLAILRLALYEMFYVAEDRVPKVVAVNEAIELAKRYSDDRSRRFINGVLSNTMEK